MASIDPKAEPFAMLALKSYLLASQKVTYVDRCQSYVCEKISPWLPSYPANITNRIPPFLHISLFANLEDGVSLSWSS